MTHPKKNKKSFFKGWYFKNQNDQTTIAFIPAIHAEKDGITKSSIQIITDEGSYCAWFSGDDLNLDTQNFSIKIGNSVFSQQGLTVDINLEGFSVKGCLQFTDWTPPTRDVMGPFRFMPFMQCNHGVLSLTHGLSGSLIINQVPIQFDGGTGYAETDWGHSFPKSYLWTQSCWQTGEHHNSIMLSVANIPFLGAHFTGCICIILFEGKEYRLATYNGVKILKYTENEVVLKQKGYTLEVLLLAHSPHPLHAPNFGSMTRIIKESPSCTVKYRFSKNGEVLFDVTSAKASFEIVK